MPAPCRARLRSPARHPRRPGASPSGAGRALAVPRGDVLCAERDIESAAASQPRSRTRFRIRRGSVVTTARLAAGRGQPVQHLAHARNRRGSQPAGWRRTAPGRRPAAPPAPAPRCPGTGPRVHRRVPGRAAGGPEPSARAYALVPLTTPCVAIASANDRSMRPSSATSVPSRPQHARVMPGVSVTLPPAPWRQSSAVVASVHRLSSARSAWTFRHTATALSRARRLRAASSRRVNPSGIRLPGTAASLARAPRDSSSLARHRPNAVAARELSSQTGPADS